MNIPNFSLERDVWGRVNLTLADGRHIENVDIYRAFPITAPTEFVCICGPDGHELVCIPELSLSSPATRQIIEEELAQREFMPIVVRIEKVLADTDPSQWQIVTDRGPTSFLMDDSDNDVRRLGPYQILLVDSHGIRYLIPDTRRLDSTSRRTLDRYL